MKVVKWIERGTKRHLIKFCDCGQEQVTKKWFFVFIDLAEIHKVVEMMLADINLS